MANKADSDHLDWKNFKYMVFDIPTDRVTYAERYNRLGMLIYLCCDMICDVASGSGGVVVCGELAIVSGGGVIVRWWGGSVVR